MFLVSFLFVVSLFPRIDTSQHVLPSKTENSYWLLLHRKSNIEFLYFGEPGNEIESKLLKTFTVKSGVPNQRPTPLPKLLGKEYWLLIKEEESFENAETAPYFLTLDVPVTEEPPYGPEPYLECGEEQCNWELPGFFGLHGVNGDNSKLALENEGSSGCIRHSDEDITYLYNLFDPGKEEVRYYIQDL